jgi:hypothetical protein
MFRTALLVVLVTAAASKSTGFASFRESLPGFGLPALRSLALAVVTAEAAAALLLVIAPRAGFLAAAALLAGFTLVLGRPLRRGQPVACRCFGASDAPVGVRHLVRNALLLLVAVGGLSGPTPAAPTAAGAVAGLALSTLAIRWDDLLFLVRG